MAFVWASYAHLPPRTDPKETNMSRNPVMAEMSDCGIFLFKNKNIPGYRNGLELVSPSRQGYTKENSVKVST